jgi:hypothetical protein
MVRAEYKRSLTAIVPRHTVPPEHKKALTDKNCQGKVLN